MSRPMKRTSEFLSQACGATNLECRASAYASGSFSAVLEVEVLRDHIGLLDFQVYLEGPGVTAVLIKLLSRHRYSC